MINYASMHVHPDRGTDAGYPLFLAHGVTGLRDAGSSMPLDILLLWRREILAGTRIGPPRQILSGQSGVERFTNGSELAIYLLEKTRHSA